LERGDLGITITELVVGSVEGVSVAAVQDAAAVGPAVVVRPVEVAGQKHVQPQSPSGWVVVQDDLVEDVVVFTQPQQVGVFDGAFGQLT